jgi:hypothetical protein
MIFHLLSINIDDEKDIVKFNNHFQTAIGIYRNSRAKNILEKRW